MNQSAAKATRREIRRAFGPRAVNAISETQQNTQATVQSVAFAHERLDAFVKREDERWDATNGAQRLIIDLAYKASEPLRRGFWGRLRWLVTGR